MSESIVPVALIGSTAFLLILILILLIYMWQRITVLEQGRLELAASKASTGGTLFGFSGREIWDALEAPEKHPDVITDLRRRYAFVLSRHIEQLIDQGQMDKQHGRESVPESQAAIGGLRGEVQSWMPQSYVSRFYRIGVQSATSPDAEMPELRNEVRSLVREILQRLKMADEASGIANLITSHTLEFNEKAREVIDDTEGEDAEDAEEAPAS